MLTLVARGLTNREIAAALMISVKTAGVHVSHILRRLDAPNRVEAAADRRTASCSPHGGGRELVMTRGPVEAPSGERITLAGVEGGHHGSRRSSGADAMGSR